MWARTRMGLPVSRHRIVSLLSDFGLADPYVAEMKAVILSVCPDACVVDVSHEIEKFNVRMGAFVLASAAPYFPEGTVHLAVVDPGVGTERRAIIVETERCSLVGPDNGLLMLAAEKQGVRHVYAIENSRYMLPKVSRTFHGRDVFAPAAAHLARGCPPADFGPEIHDYVRPAFAKAKVSDRCIVGEVIHIDDFGNIVTNVSSDDLEGLEITEGERFRVELGEKSLTLRLCRAYGEVEPQIPLAIIGSHDFLEVSVNLGNATLAFGVKVGDPVRITP